MIIVIIVLLILAVYDSGPEGLDLGGQGRNVRLQLRLAGVLVLLHQGRRLELLVAPVLVVVLVLPTAI